MKINVLGTPYEVVFTNERDDPALAEYDGYCDESVHRIVVNDYTQTSSDMGDRAALQKKTIRHELVHAFLFESGLGADWEHKPFGHEETVVDWIARQTPKLMEAFRAANAL